MKNTTRNKINLLFSSFLVIGYIVCTYFFSQLANQVSGAVGSLIQSLILVLFGLLLFYATRVGEGRQVRRFSLAVLLLLVVPCVYIIVASFVSALPFHDQLAPVNAVSEAGGDVRFQPLILMLACVGLGYGVPYTFLSGYEIKTDEEGEKEEAADETVLEGGIAADIAEAQAEAEAEAAEVIETEAELEDAEEDSDEPAEELTEEEAEKIADKAAKAEEEIAAEAEAEVKIKLQQIPE